MNSFPLDLVAIIAITCIISFIGFSNTSFFEKYKFQVGAVQRGEYLRLLSAGFLHADYMHLFFNMLTLYFFAPMVIYGYGQMSFYIIYIGSIILGNLFCLYYYKKVPYYSAIGASGGVSGILFATVALDPVAIEVNFIPGFLFGALYFGYSVYMMLNPRYGDNIGHAAHLGGAAFGLLYAIVSMPDLALNHAWQLVVMALPLIYLSYQIFVRKRIG